MTKLATLVFAMFAAVAFNANAASHTGAAPMKASAPAAKASAPAAKASDAAKKGDAAKAAAKKEEAKK